MPEYFPSGFGVNVSVGVNYEPLIALVFIGVDGEEATEITLTEQEGQAIRHLLDITLVRAAVLREVTTAFPEQRQALVETLAFRWSGGDIDGDST